MLSIANLTTSSSQQAGQLPPPPVDPSSPTAVTKKSPGPKRTAQRCTLCHQWRRLCRPPCTLCPGWSSCPTAYERGHPEYKAEQYQKKREETKRKREDMKKERDLKKKMRAEMLKNGVSPAVAAMVGHEDIVQQSQEVLNLVHHDIPTYSGEIVEEVEAHHHHHHLA